MGSEVGEGIGTINWWGFSPSLDLTQLQKSSDGAAGNDESATRDELNILLFGAGDCRHILRTLASLRLKNSQQKVNFYVVENYVELLARQILLLSLAHEPAQKLGLRQKAEMFLEIYGNSHVRAQTSEYIASKASALIDLVTDPDEMEQKMTFMSIDQLKYKEKDDLETIFKFWRKKSPDLFNMTDLWEYRLRNYFKQRYDARTNLADWDYQMKLKDLAPIVHVKQYTRWRTEGLAFEMRDAPYDVANRTLGSGKAFREKSGTVEKRGYWGDIVNSPYIAFGVESEHKELFRMQSKQFVRSAVDVAFHNVCQYVHEIFTGTTYDTKAGLDSDGTVEELPEDGPGASEDASASGACGSDAFVHALPGVKVILLPLKAPADLATKAKFRGMFDVAYFSNGMVHHLTPELGHCIAPHAHIVLEGVCHILGLTQEQKGEYATRVAAKATACGATAVGEPNAEKDAHYYYARKAT